MTFKEKIHKILKVNNLNMTSVEDISSKTGIKAGTIYKAMARKNGKGNLGTKNTRILVDKLGINLDWWDSGKEPVFKEKGTQLPDEATIKNPEHESRIIEKIDKLVENVNSFGDFNRFLVDEVNRLRKKIIDLGGEI